MNIQKTFLIRSLICFMMGLSFLKPGFSQSQAKNNFEDWSEKPAIVSPATITSAPSDAVVLFAGNDLNQWESLGKKGSPAAWTIAGDRFTAEPGAGDIVTKKSFGDCQLHVEWMIPVSEVQSNLNWGNSGIFLMDLYEVQIYSSYLDEHKIYYNGQAGSIYKQYKPLVNACLPAGEWQSFDIVFIAPCINSNQSVQSPAKLTVFQNGILIQNNASIKGPTTHGDFTEYKVHPGKLPVRLQEHGSRVSYRNIWIREL